MRRLKCALLIAITCCAQTVPTATVSGTVTDATTGVPMVGAFVGASWKGGFYSNTRTDSNGHYSLPKLPAATIYIGAVRKGSHRPVPRGVRVNLAPEGLTVQDFALQPASTISGTISDSDTGEPIAACHVTAIRKVTVSGVAGYIRDIPDGSANTNDMGWFEITDLDAGEYILSLEAGPTDALRGARTCRGPTYYQNSSRRDRASSVTITKPGNTTVNIRLQEPATYSVSGVVSLPDGAQPSMIMISIRGLDPDGPQTGATVLLNRPGAFRALNLAEGEYSLLVTDWRVAPIRVGSDNRANGDGYIRKFIHEQRIRVEDHDIEDMQILLRPTVPATITGTVRIEDGSKLPPGIQMALSPAGGQILDCSMTSTGPFELTAIPGAYWPHLTGALLPGYAVTHILAGAEDLASSPLNITNKAVSLTFVVSPKVGTLTGNAEDAGAVFLFPEPTDAEVDTLMARMAIPEVDGVFTFNDVAPGLYRTVIVPQQDHLVSRDQSFMRKSVDMARPIEIKAGQVTRLTLHL